MSRSRKIYYIGFALFIGLAVIWWLQVSGLSQIHSILGLQTPTPSPS